MNNQSIYPKEVMRFQSAQSRIQVDVLRDIHDDVDSMKKEILAKHRDSTSSQDTGIEDHSIYPKEVTRFKSGKNRLNADLLQEIHEDMDAVSYISDL